MTNENYNELQFQYLSLITNFPELLDMTIIEEKYLSNRFVLMFRVLQEEHNKKKSSEFVIQNLIKYEHFDIDLFAELLANNIYFVSKEQKFKEIEIALIDYYKDFKIGELIKNYNGNKDEFIKKINEIENETFDNNETLKAIDILNSLKNKNTKIELGYYNLDLLLNLSQNDLLVIAGGTGVGKSCFALNLLSMLSRQGYQCIYFNMEMSSSILYKRLLSIETGYDIRRFNDISKFDENEKDIIRKYLKDIEKREIIFVNQSLSASDISKRICRIKTKKHVVAFIDHIGLVKSKGSSLYEKMTNIAKEIRAISLSNNCTLIGLCQLSRESQKENIMPKLQDLRDSGEIEQSARKVLLLYSPNNNSTEQKINIQLIIAKNDDGQKGKKDFIFDRYTQRFIEKVE